MKQYFMQLELNQPKNKAQEAAQEFAREYADCLIEEKNYQKFKKELNERIKEINWQFPRCGDISPLRESNQWRDPDEFEIWVNAGIAFLIRSVKRTEFTQTSRDPMYDLMGDMKAH
jgi:hypothetical protein